MVGPRAPAAVAAAVLVPVLMGGCVVHRHAAPHRVDRPGAADVRTGPLPTPTPPVPLTPLVPLFPAAGGRWTGHPPPGPGAPGDELTRSLDRALAGYGGRLTAAVRDLSTGRDYRYHDDLQLPTGSTSKVNILMALLLSTPWRGLDARARRDADRMIRLSDNEAADRLYERIGLEAGLAEANRRFGLERTYAPPGRCVDLYCWGITRSTAEDQLRLLGALATERSPLGKEDREQVLRLMGEVIPEQRWGISAGACEGDRVVLKNGWLRRVSSGRWVVVSAGLIRGGGRDYAVAVLSEDNRRMAEGVTRVEDTAKRIMSALRGGGECAGERGAPRLEGEKEKKAAKSP
ncbi:serine hydrolase [Planomonospora corallina]|uniref:Serine hydrolase n=1 Tax=Planomonospora corallina TaxID=1806052 RepID=A0ABV8IB34_9ACTN